MANYYGPLTHRTGSDTSIVVDPRFGTAESPTQPAGWGGSGGGGTVVGTYTGGVRGVGFHVPPGALSNLTAALANNATDQRVEIPYLGDSTGYGSGPDLAGGPPRKLRELFLTAGVTDGGIGSINSWTGTYSATSNFSDGGKVYTWPPNGVGTSRTIGETYTATGPGTAIRIVGWNIGQLDYSIDGGATVSIPAMPSVGWHYVSGLAAGTHTIVVTNARAGSATGGTSVYVEFLNTNGVVVHQDSVSGGTSNNYSAYIESRNTGTLGNDGLQYALGKIRTENGVDDWGSGPAARPAARNVKAAIWALGLNDMSGITADASADLDGAVVATKLQENAATFIRMCRTGGVDPVIVVPHFESDSRGWRFAGRGQAALVAVAEAHGAAWCNYNDALRLAGIPLQSNPHLPQSSYDVEAQFLFDNVLSLALPA